MRAQSSRLVAKLALESDRASTQGRYENPETELGPIVRVQSMHRCNVASSVRCAGARDFPSVVHNAPGPARLVAGRRTAAPKVGVAWACRVPTPSDDGKLRDDRDRS